MEEEKSVYSLTKLRTKAKKTTAFTIQEGGKKGDNKGANKGDNKGANKGANMDEFYEKLNEYYKLKQEYSKKLQTQQNSIMKDNTLNMKQKRDKYRKIKMKCINCARNVGTIFNNDNGILTAVCGDKANRCPLNIKINRGKFINLEDLIGVFQSGVDEIKEEIIKIKMDLLFGYEQESVTLSKFTKLKNELVNDLETVVGYKTRFIEIVSKLNNKPELNMKMTLFYNKIATIQSTIEEFNETGRIQLIKDMVTMYETELMPLLTELRNLKYSYMAMEHNAETNTHTLVRKVFTIQDLSEPFENPKVEYFEIGGGGVKAKDSMVNNISGDDDSD